MSDADEPTNHTPRFRHAFETSLAEIRSVTEAEFVPITIDIPSAVATVLGALKGIGQLRPEFVEHLPTFDISILDGLQSRALALGHAQTNYQTATEPPASLMELAESAIASREVLVCDVGTLISRGALESTVLKELKGINGYKNIAFDLFALSNIYKKNWAKVTDKTAVKQAELDQAENLADQLVTAVGEREQAPVVAAAAVRDRQAAFTLFINDYDEVRSVIGYLRRKQGDAESIAPSLYLGRTSSKKKPTEETPANATGANEPSTTSSASTSNTDGHAGANNSPATHCTTIPVNTLNLSETGPYLS